MWVKIGQAGILLYGTVFCFLRSFERKGVKLDSAIFCVRSRLEKGRHLIPVALVQTHLGSVRLSLEERIWVLGLSIAKLGGGRKLA